MARLLVKSVDHSHTDPEIDRKASYKRGDVVVVMPDDHVWGVSEGPPKFEQVDMPGLTVAEVRYLTEPEQQRLDEITSAALRKNRRLMRLFSRVKPREDKRRRRYQVDLQTHEIEDKRKF